MTVIVGIVLFCLGAAQWAPDTTFGKMMRRTLIELPADALARMTTSKLAIGVLAFVALCALLAAGPELIALVGIGDLVLYADAAALTLVAGALVTYRSLRALVAARLRQWARSAFTRLAAGRARRATRVRRLNPPPTPDDSEPEPAWTLALA